MKKLLAFLLAFAMIFSLACVPAWAETPQTPTGPEDKEVSEETGEEVSEEVDEEISEEVSEEVFADWNPDAPALSALVDYVDAVTDESSPDFIPVEDRIAVFDMDGTLYAELFPTYLEYYMLAWRILKDPSITPDAEMLALGREIRECALDRSFSGDMPMRHAIQAARAYAGLTQTEFADFVTSILVREADGFEGMSYATAFYTPMIEVVEYLQDNDFEVYVVSGSDRAICRTLIEGIFDIPYNHIIGMDVGYEATNQGDTDGLDYVYQSDDAVVRTDELIIKNLKMNKVIQIVRDIGRQPVISFGNSSGDVSMHNYTLFNNPYRSIAFMLIANDEERDYGNTEKAEKLGREWEADGYHVISMRDDFRTIYGDKVVKTGSFRWADELAEDRIADVDSPEWVGRLDAAQDAEQLFIIAGVGETTAYISMHEKDAAGSWKQIITTPGFISELGKEKEGDGKTPVGTFRFNAAFGIARDPGCAIKYEQVDGDSYWSSDQREGYHYNQMVSIRDYPDLDTTDSERIMDYPVHYEYCLNVSYNADGTPGLGSAIFLHCLGPCKPYTRGCIAIPKDQMLTVMKRVTPECVVVIDSLEKLSPETWADWGFAPAGEDAPPDSSVFTAEDIAKAEAVIHEEFDSWGCELHDLAYAGDDCCTEENLAWMNSLGDGECFSQCIEFLSDFRSPEDAAGAWEPDSEYTDWQWWLARTDGGDWQLLTWGY